MTSKSYFLILGWTKDKNKLNSWCNFNWVFDVLHIHNFLLFCTFLGDLPPNLNVLGKLFLKPNIRNNHNDDDDNKYQIV